jgi:hypothetical protein
MDRERKCEDFTKAPICLRASSTYGCRLLDAVFANGRQRTPTKSYSGAPVRIKLRTPMLLRFRCNFVRLKDDLPLLNVPQTCASTLPNRSVSASRRYSTIGCFGRSMVAVFASAAMAQHATVRFNPLFEAQPQVSQEYPYSIVPSMTWRAPVIPLTWDTQTVVPFTLEEKRPESR